MLISTRSTVAYGVVVASLGAALVGCGSSSSGGGDDGSGAALSKAELVTQANAICKAEEAAGEAVTPPANIQDAEQAAAYFDQIDPIISGSTDKLEALEPADDVAADWDAFIAARKKFSDQIHSIREKADNADRSGLTDLQNLSTTDLKAAADKVGATSCAEEAS